MNVSSSRSHAIFTITVESSQLGDDGEQHVKMGKLHLVDLAVCIKKINNKIKNFYQGNYLLFNIFRVQRGKVRLKQLVFVCVKRQKSIYLYQHWEMLYQH